MVYVVHQSSVNAKHLTMERTQNAPNVEFTADALSINPKIESQSCIGVASFPGWAVASGTTLKRSSSTPPDSGHKYFLRSGSEPLEMTLISELWTH